MQISVNEFKQIVKEEVAKKDLTLLQWQDYILDMLNVDYKDEIQMIGNGSSVDRENPSVSEIEFTFIKPTEPTKKFRLLVKRGLQRSDNTREWNLALTLNGKTLASGSPKKLFGDTAEIDDHKKLYGAVEDLLTKYVIPNVAEQYPSLTDTSMAKGQEDNQQSAMTQMRTDPLKKDIAVIDKKLEILTKKEDKIKNDLAKIQTQTIPLKQKKEKDQAQIVDIEKGMTESIGAESVKVGSIVKMKTVPQPDRIFGLGTPTSPIFEVKPDAKGVVSQVLDDKTVNVVWAQYPKNLEDKSKGWKTMIQNLDIVR